MSGPPDAIDHTEARTLADSLLRRLFPLCRSLTGEGLLESLAILSEHIPLQITEVPTGTKVFDWVVPEEWHIRDAYVRDRTGRRVIDFRKSNLHVVSYSVPVRARMSLDALRPHLHTLPAQPDAIPYLTSYYERSWGFCLTHNQLASLDDGEYEVCIDSALKPGALRLGEAVLPGTEDREVLFSTYCCHPSMANNELSGPILTALLYRYLSSLPSRRYTYRFYFGPETIGALAYLSLRGEHLQRKLAAGLVVTCCGDAGPFTYKRPRSPSDLLDKAVLHALKHSGIEFSVVPFVPTGSDERQYCSPGFDLPVGSLMRSMYGTYPEYHTSLDNLDFVSAESLVEALRVYANVVYVLEHNRRFRGTKPFGEPHLSKYGLYPTTGGQKEQNVCTELLRYVLNYADGVHDLVDIANGAGVAVWRLGGVVDDLLRVGLIEAEPKTARDDHKCAELQVTSETLL